MKKQSMCAAFHRYNVQWTLSSHVIKFSNKCTKWSQSGMTGSNLVGATLGYISENYGNSIDNAIL